MTEDQKKPKTTLIKHRKNDALTVTDEPQEKPEKKKVVVVKKKVVVVKKAPPARAAEPAGEASPPERSHGSEPVVQPAERTDLPPVREPERAAPVEKAAETRPEPTAPGREEAGAPAEKPAASETPQTRPAAEAPARDPGAGSAGPVEAGRAPAAEGPPAPAAPQSPTHGSRPAGGRPEFRAPADRPSSQDRGPRQDYRGPAGPRPSDQRPGDQRAGDRPPYPGRGYQDRGPRPDAGQYRSGPPGPPRNYRDTDPGDRRGAPQGYPEGRAGARPGWVGGGRPPGPGRPSGPGYQGPGRPSGPGRPPGRPGEGFQRQGDRPGGPRGPGRPGPARPGGFAGGPPAKKDGDDTQKSGTKKFFKTRKNTFVKKSRDQEREKFIQVKKKTIARANPIPKEISIMEAITVSELARKLNLKASELIGKLMSMGMMVTINQQIDAETATLLAEEYGSKVNIVSLYDETVIGKQEDQEGDLQPRPPIVTVMGHVDHGKTKLLDAIRSTNVVAGEFGGITQHIGAYSVELPDRGRVVFLDTPGHEAFTTMRARGADVTDIVVLVVAANDGVMPQTVEAINHAKAAKVPIIVAINKIDLPEANPDRVKQQLSEHDLVPEAWGGNTLYCEISALKKIGIDELLESILLQAEVLELKANYNCRAEGRIIESKIDLGRGIVATVLVERGTLRVGDSFVAGVYPGKVRAMFDDKGEKLEEATPATPVEILGFTGIPNAGDPFQVTESEKEARQVGGKRQELKKMEGARTVKKVTLDNLYEQIKEGGVQELNLVIKGDVHGSVEALQTALEKLSTPEIRLNVIHAAAGAINRDDVMLASASDAIIIGFNVRPTPNAQAVADQEKVDIRRYNVIYEAVDAVRAAMEGLLAPDLKEQTLGVAEVRNLFKVPKIGTIAGCYVLSGKVRRNAMAQIVRDGVEVYRGKISSLKRFKDDAREVEAGYECGIGIENFNDLKVGDQIEAFEVIEMAKKLDGGSTDGGTKNTEG